LAIAKIPKEPARYKLKESDGFRMINRIVFKHISQINPNFLFILFLCLFECKDAEGTGSWKGSALPDYSFMGEALREP